MDVIIENGRFPRLKKFRWNESPCRATIEELAARNQSGRSGDAEHQGEGFHVYVFVRRGLAHTTQPRTQWKTTTLRLDT